jgi:cytoskeletal protein RodZ
MRPVGSPFMFNNTMLMIGGILLVLLLLSSILFFTSDDEEEIAVKAENIQVQTADVVTPSVTEVTMTTTTVIAAVTIPSDIAVTTTVQQVQVEPSEVTTPPVVVPMEAVVPVETTPKIYGNHQGSHITLKAKEEVWFEIKDSTGAVVFSKMFQPGDIYYVPDLSELILTVGNAGGLEISADGQVIPPFGPNGVKRSNIKLEVDALKNGTAYKG